MNRLLEFKNIPDYKSQVVHQVSYLPLSHITALMSDFMRLLCYD